MKVVIMAGGKGTRIASINSEVPKPMITICGKPILEWQIENLKACGLTDITLVTGHLGHVIQEYFGDGSHWGVCISYFAETEPLGTAGALFKMPELTDDFLLMCGDVVLDVDFNRFIAFHRAHHAWATLMAHPNNHPYDSSLLVTEMLPPQTEGGLPVDTHLVVRWMIAAPHSQGENMEDERDSYSNLVNAGIEIISPRLLQEVSRNYVPRHPETPDKIDLDRDVLKPFVGSGHIFAYTTPEYIKDMGTPDRYYEVENDIKQGKVKARNLQHKQKAVFLDRDGTINQYVGFLTTAEQFELIPQVADAIKRINQSGRLAIVVTNQPVIARGECSWDELQHIHQKMETELGKSGAYLDGIYVCPHHPDKGFAGERPAYKVVCDCRKPKAGLLLQAAADFNIDLSQSFMIGDSDNDVEAGRNAGVRDSIKIERNKPGALNNVLSEIL